MDQEQFEKMFEKQVEACRTVLVTKAREYASGTDRLHNFKVAGVLTHRTPEQALWGMLAKHLVSLSDMVADTSKDLHYPAAVWDEKLGDALNYLFLLRALVYESATQTVNSNKEK